MRRTALKGGCVPGLARTPSKLHAIWLRGCGDKQARATWSLGQGRHNGRPVLADIRSGSVTSKVRRESRYPGLLAEVVAAESVGWRTRHDVAGCLAAGLPGMAGWRS
jgi:hypothetical protein